MRALVKTAKGAGQLALLEVDPPRLSARDVLIRVAGAAICGSDVLIRDDVLKIYNPPVILGHNVAGVVTELGPEAEGFSMGDPVVVDMNVGACGRCAFCRSQREYLCPGRQGLGYGINGGMADLLAVPDRWLVKVPVGVPLVEAAAVDLANAVHAVVDRSDIGYGSSVVIFGPGFQGLAMLQVAKLLGASPVVLVGLERHRERLRLARELGADLAVAADRENLRAVVAEATGGQGADAVLEATGDQSSLAQALSVIRRGGGITMLGSLPENAVVDMHQVVFDELNLRGVRGYTRENVEFYLSALRDGRLNVKPFVHTFPLSEWEEAFAARVRRQVIEPVLVP